VSLNFIDKVQRHKLDRKIISWIRNNKIKWLTNYKTYPNPNPEKKKTLTEHVYYSEYERPDFNFSSNFNIKNFIEAEFLFKYLDITKLKKEKIEKFKLVLKEYPNFNKIANVISYVLIDYFENTERNLRKENNLLKEDRVFLYEYSTLRINQLKNLNPQDIKSLFNIEKDLVIQNENVYPIMFNYFDYIKKEVLNKNEIKNKYTTNEEVFRYISNLTKSIKWTAVKTYYNQKFLYLTGVKK